MKIFVLIFTLSFALISAQTHRFIYEFKYKQNPKQTEFQKVNMTLDVNPENVKFYNYRYVEIDSTNITKGQNSQLWDNSTNVIVRSKNSNTNSNYTMINDVFVFDTEDKIDWNLDKETKKFENYTLQKATSNFGGRKWTAWFAKSIPFNSGPHKFYGLPGLIVELKDDRYNFHYLLIKSENYTDTKNIQTLDDFPGIVPVNIAQYKKKMLSLYEDPLAFINTTNFNFENSEGIFLKDNTLVKPDNVREVRKAQQEKIRRFNNPVELDKIIVYPIK